jgi:hypothetical protein
VSPLTPNLTLVTGAVDIGRGSLQGGFGRPFHVYCRQLKALLSLNLPTVVYANRSFKVPASRSERKLVPVDRSSLEKFIYFDKIQAIRGSPAWRHGTPWLPHSPQAGLAHYNPLVMSKLLWLADQVRANPFGTRHFVWIDGGIINTVPFDLLQKALGTPCILNHLQKFLLLCYPYRTHREVHGFEHTALARYANVPAIEWVARGGFFGGSGDFVLEAARLYDVMLGHTLDHGYMGTEESVLTLLAYLHPAVFDRFFIRPDGMVAYFFSHLLRANER